MFTELSYVKRVSVLPRSELWAISLKNLHRSGVVVVVVCRFGVNVCNIVQSQHSALLQPDIIIDDAQLNYVVAVM